MFKKKPQQFMITIPEPCSEEWAEMRVVDDCHRHCAACERTLTDFAQMNDDELVLFFKHNQGKVCGRFRKDQLNRSLTPIPEKTSRANWWKAAVLLPLALFSKSASGQQLYSDSARAAQEIPYPQLVQQDSASGDSIKVQLVNSVVPPFPWTALCTEGGWYVGGVPYVVTTYPSICASDLITLVVPQVDTAIIVAPKTETEVGIEAASAPVAVKIPDTQDMAHAAHGFGAIVPESGPKK